MRRLPAALLLVLALAASAAFLAAAPDEPKTLPAEPADRPAPAERKEGVLLRRIEELLRARQDSLMDQVRKIVDQELRRAAEEQRKAQEARRAQAEKAGKRAKEIGKRLDDLKGSLEQSIARARQALGEPPPKPAAPAEPDEEAAEKPVRQAVPEPYRKLMQAMRLYESGEYEKAIADLAEAMKGLDTMTTAEARRYRAEALYHTGCAHAILGRADSAFQSLDKAVRAGYRNLDKIENDAELDPLRDDPRFERLRRYARSLKG
jgi:Skp family chaperone for outer membrane proteins